MWEFQNDLLQALHIVGVDGLIGIAASGKTQLRSFIQAAKEGGEAHLEKQDDSSDYLRKSSKKS